jgi:hypothetical protein
MTMEDYGHSFASLIIALALVLLVFLGFGAYSIFHSETDHNPPWVIHSAFGHTVCWTGPGGPMRGDRSRPGELIVEYGLVLG